MAISSAPEFIEPEANSYHLAVRLTGISKAAALKIAEAVGSICDHEGYFGTEITVAHVKFDG